MAVRGTTTCQAHGGSPNDGGPQPGRRKRVGKPPEVPRVLSETDGRRKGYWKGLTKSAVLGDLYEEYLSDPDLMELRNEIAMARALFTEYLQARGDVASPRTPMDLATLEATQKHLLSLSEQIARMVERKNRIDFSEQHSITIPALVAIAARIANIINSRVSAENERLLIAGDLRVLFGGKDPNSQFAALVEAPFRAENTLVENVVDGEFTEVGPDVNS